jgi:hypothetical protein
LETAPDRRVDRVFELPAAQDLLRVLGNAMTSAYLRR